jgi:hypothetical protein
LDNSFLRAPPIANAVPASVKHANYVPMNKVLFQKPTAQLPPLFKASGPNCPF